MKKIAYDNRGMTLVELIIAVVILAIAVVPLLHAFVTGANTQKKAREYGEATTVATNILESIEAMGVKSVLSGSSIYGKEVNFYDSDWTTANPTIAADEIAKSGSRLYYAKLEDVSFDNSSTSYDARLTLEASNTAASEINSTPLIKSNAVDVSLNMSIADASIVDDLKTQNTAGPLTDADAMNRLTRTVDISVSPGSTDKQKAVAMTAKYFGKNAVAYLVEKIDPVTGESYTETEYRDYNGTRSFSKFVAIADNASANPEDSLFSLFVYMKGFYLGNGLDNINISNRMGNNRDFNVFLVDVSTETEINSAKPTYTTRISYSGQIMHSVVVDPSNPGSTSSKLSTRVFTNLKNASYYLANGWQKALSGKLVETKANDCFYNIKVELFAPDTDAAILSMDSSSLT